MKKGLISFAFAASVLMFAPWMQGQSHASGRAHAPIAEGHLPHAWPQALRIFARLELLYGDRAIDSQEARYLAGAAFPNKPKAALRKNHEVRIRAIGVILRLIPPTSGAPEACIAAISARTGIAGEKVRALVEAGRGKSAGGHSPAAAACTKVVAKKGKMVLKDKALMDEVPYALLDTKGITPAIYTQFVVNNPSLLPQAVHALTFRKDIDAYAPPLAEVAIKNPHLKRQRHRILVLAEYMSRERMDPLLIQMLATVPQRTIFGQTTYTLSTGTWDGTILTACRSLPRERGIRDSYRKARTARQVLEFFVRPTRGGTWKKDKGWLLYRYHPKLVMPAVRWYAAYNTPAASNAIELKYVLRGVLQHVNVLADPVPAAGELKAVIRELAFEGTSPVYRANGLYLLMGSAGPADILKLSALLRDRSIVDWEEQGIRSHSGPLVGFVAVGCLRSIGTKESLAALQSVQGDEKVDPRVRKDAAEAVIQAVSQAQRRKTTAQLAPWRACLAALQSDVPSRWAETGGSLRIAMNAAQEPDKKALLEAMTKDYRSLCRSPKRDAFLLAEVAGLLAIGHARLRVTTYVRPGPAAWPRETEPARQRRMEVLKWVSVQMEHAVGKIDDPAKRQHVFRSLAGMLSLQMMYAERSDRPEEVQKVFVKHRKALLLLADGNQRRAAWERALAAHAKGLATLAGWSHDKAAIRALIAQYVKAHNKKDKAALLATFTEDSEDRKFLAKATLQETISPSEWTIVRQEAIQITIHKGIAGIRVVTTYRTKDGKPGKTVSGSWRARKTPAGWRFVE